MKISKFLICKNPMLTGDQSDRLFILHTRQPIILAEVNSFDAENEAEIQVFMSRLTMGAKLDYGNKVYVLAPVWSTGIDDDLPAQTIADTYAGIMRRMADWYESCLNFEKKST